MSNAEGWSSFERWRGSVAVFLLIVVVVAVVWILLNVVRVCVRVNVHCKIIGYV